jgi:hypothetical protein
MSNRDDRERDRGQKPLPVCKAILLCDEVRHDPEFGKFSIIGILTGFVLPAFPGWMTPFCVYLFLVDIMGEYAITTQIWDLRDNEEIARSPDLRIGRPGELSRQELWFPVKGVYLDHPGAYDLIVFADEREIDRIRFNAIVPGDFADARNKTTEY